MLRNQRLRQGRYDQKTSIEIQFKKIFSKYFIPGKRPEDVIENNEEASEEHFQSVEYDYQRKVRCQLE